MAVPDFRNFFKPRLDLAGGGKDHSVQEAREVTSRVMTLAESDLKELLPSGTQTKFDKRVAWAKSYFIQAKVLKAPRRSTFRITQRGLALHKAGRDRFDTRILNQYPEFLEFPKAKSQKEEEQEASQETQEETLQNPMKA